MRPAPEDGGCPRLSAETLEAVRRAGGGGAGVTAGEVAEVIGLSRVTARRYLEHLAEPGQSARARVTAARAARTWSIAPSGRDRLWGA